MDTHLGIVFGIFLVISIQILMVDEIFQVGICQFKGEIWILDALLESGFGLEKQKGCVYECECISRVFFLGLCSPF